MRNQKHAVSELEEGRACASVGCHGQPSLLCLASMHHLLSQAPCFAGRSYAQSKLANVLFTRELAQRLREEGSALEAFCLHPG